MQINRIDFTLFSKEIPENWSILYNGDKISEEKAKKIINDFNIYHYDNMAISNKAEFFFLPTEKANLLKEWIHNLSKNKLGHGSVAMAKKAPSSEEQNLDR